MAACSSSATSGFCLLSAPNARGAPAYISTEAPVTMVTMLLQLGKGSRKSRPDERGDDDRRTPALWFAWCSSRKRPGCSRSCSARS